MPIIKHQTTKSLQIKPNTRSSDFVTPNFIYGCAGGCRNSYCYVMRHNYENIYINDNVQQILQVIANHASSLSFPKPINQIDPKYWTYDIGCSTDIALHWKHYNWIEVFDFFKQHEKIKATFATKYANRALLNYQPERKIRIRFSLMPQSISNILEPKTSSILQRISAIQTFFDVGYEVHINFSPIVVYENWLTDYKDLFEQIDLAIPDITKAHIKAECIFLTHNVWQHQRNIRHQQQAAESILWQPLQQEDKVSQYGGQALRYKANLKRKFIENWRSLHDQIIPWNEIRYIF